MNANCCQPTRPTDPSGPTDASRQTDPTAPTDPAPATDAFARPPPSGAGLGAPVPPPPIQPQRSGAAVQGGAPAVDLDAVWRRLQAHHQQLDRELQQAYRRLGLVHESDWNRVRAAARADPERVGALRTQLAAVEADGGRRWAELKRMDFQALAGRVGLALLRG
ncbi:MAG: hypothetical protein IPG96_05525 [Proteobacteria bacterium]|nr:hypothetical protein [Pseudomonadota bacterium]